MRFALLLALTGCNALLGLDSGFHAPDGGGVTNHVGVTGVSRITYHTELTHETHPEDLLSTYTIDAYTVDDAGVHVYPGTAGLDGTFAIPDVPATDYYLRLVRKTPDVNFLDSEITHLTTHDVDLSTDRAGKRDAPPPLVDSSPIELSAATTAAFTSGDGYALWSSLERDDADAAFLQRGPVQGATSLTGAELDWQMHRPLDDNGVWLLHRQRDTVAPLGVTATRVVEAGHVTGLAQTPAVPLPLTFTLAAGKPVQTVFSVNQRALVRVMGAFTVATADVRAAPDNGAGVFGGPVVFRMSRRLPSPARASTPLSVSFPDPFPDTWSRLSSVFFSSDLRHVGTFAAGTLTLSDHTSVRASTRPGEKLALPTLDEQVPGVTSVQLDGAPFHDGVHSPATPIRIAWDAVPGASYYYVTMVGVAPGNRFASTQITTTLPEAVFVPATFENGFHVAVSVGTVFASALEPAIRKVQRPSRSREIAQGVLYISSTCGNGTREGTEACDSGGASATCNWDCTAPLCGDGILNTAAGEVCDLGSSAIGMDSALCDDSCHPIVCGDGTKDPREVCDDGNLKSHDGCSETCDVEIDPSQCGNGATDPGEDCDDGPAGSVLCTPDCLATYCGDGTKQSPPGRTEQCDDGNTRSGDGCSADCRTE